MGNNGSPRDRNVELEEVSMTIALPDALEKRLRAQAARLGLQADQYAADLLARHLPAEPREQSLADLFAEWAADDATDDPAELARRNAEFEGFKQEMNRARRESEGPNARIPFP
jgi:hypothetical protein